MIFFRFKLGKSIKTVFLALLALFLGIYAQPVAANIPSPRLKPAVPNHSEILNQQDAKLFRSAMQAADRRGWSETERLGAQIGDATARDILLWRRAYTGAADLNEMLELIKLHPEWPAMVTIRSRAEKKMFDDPLDHRTTISLLSLNDPVSGEGRAALARAYYGTGDNINGDRWLKLAWREARLTRDRQRKLYAQYKSRLSPEDHAARADYLIWQGTRYYSSAEALLSLMPAAERKLMTARIRIGGNRSGMNAAINALSSEQLKDTGLLYERAYWRRKRKSKDYALSTYLDVEAPASTQRGRERMWYEKKLMAYWLLEDKEYSKAYEIVQHHGFKSGTEFAEAEFLAGWLALSYLDRADKALTHFTILADGVSYPVSKARGHYWQGRAAEAMGNMQAQSYFAQAASFIHTYYGQLAAEHMASGSYNYISLPAEDKGEVLKSEFEQRDIIKALRLIGEVGNESVFRQFAYHLDDRVEHIGHLSLLGQIAREYQFPAPAVRAAKQSGRFGQMLAETGYPMPSVITNLGSDFDIPFVLSIARQESEFNTNAVSSARAYGMMQMIDSTARLTARKHKERYNRSWLTTDQSYAARLGALHLNDLLEEFDGSYIMAAAAYNAGSSRVRRWIKQYGDPRLAHVDPINWVENIPFSETRNYVQRVMENMQVYRARLAGGTTELQLDQALNIGQTN